LFFLPVNTGKKIGGLADWRIGGLADWRIGGLRIDEFIEQGKDKN